MFADNFKRLAKENTNFRQVLHTGVYSQVVAMSIPVGQDIGTETHPNTDQILIIVEGEGEAVISGESHMFGDKEIIFVPAGYEHNIRNLGDDDMKLISIYSPPEHPEGTVHVTKEQAEQSEG